MCRCVWLTRTTTPAWSWMTWRCTPSRRRRISGCHNRIMPAGGLDSSSRHSSSRSIDGPFKVTLTGHRLVCSKSHITVMTRRTKRPNCGLVSGNYHICRLSGVSAPEAGGLTTCVAECQYTKDKTKNVVIEIPNKNEGWKLCELASSDRRNREMTYTCSTTYVSFINVNFNSSMETCDKI